MKWELIIDYAEYSELVQVTFEEEPKELEHDLPVISYYGTSCGLKTRVFIPVNKVLGWTLEEVEEEE